MTNIELYINETLCDIQKPDSLGIRLNRVLINPSELAMKDAQYSYSITIPSTPNNDAIFNYSNVEEVKNKFNHNYKAQVYVDSISVFDGLFKLSEIDEKGNYKGNLVLPMHKTVKDLFGEKKMNELGKWTISTTDTKNPEKILELNELFNKYNLDKGIPECIFPLVLYGLLAKVPKDVEGNYSDKDLWDEYVRLGIEDFPPSLNCLQTIKKIFNNRMKDNKKGPMTITGNAFSDERLQNLYMSYRNPVEYEQPWHWGYLGEMRIGGKWTNYRVEKGTNGKNNNCFERAFHFNELDRPYYVVNFFNSSMVEIDKEGKDDKGIDKFIDKGTNILQSEVAKSNIQQRRRNTMLTIPVSGLYEINFKASIVVNKQDFTRWKTNGLHVLSGESKKKQNNFDWRGYEVKILRDFATNDFKLDNQGLDGQFYRVNMPQDAVWNNKSETVYYFPVFDRNTVQFVDPVKNELLVSGFRWGERNGHNDYNPIANSEIVIDKDRDRSRILAIKNGWSWDNKFSQKEKICSAIESPAYKVWRIEDLDDDNIEFEETEEDEEIPDKWVWEKSDRFKVDVAGLDKNTVKTESPIKGEGSLNQIIWLNKGEHLTVVGVSDQGEIRKGSRHSTKKGWARHDITFDLHIKPVSPYKDWVQVNEAGTGIKEMNTKDLVGFDVKELDLSRFLPSNIKIDEWLDNFCKAFNLSLLQPTPGNFVLEKKQKTVISDAGSVVDLHNKVSLLKTSNQTLGLPSEFQIGFTINKEEEGYEKDNKRLGIKEKEDGGGSFSTGSLDSKVVAQTSNFSYNWYKEIRCKVLKSEAGEKESKEYYPLQIPVITNQEVWTEERGSDYVEMMKKLYTDYAQRFWYRTGESVAIDNAFRNQSDLWLPNLSNTFGAERGLKLDYHDKENSILRTYFGIVATNDSNYTFAECYLTPDEYEGLSLGKLVVLNSDLYYVAAIEGYDPLGKSKTKLKLIRRI